MDSGRQRANRCGQRLKLEFVVELIPVGAVRENSASHRRLELRRARPLLGEETVESQAICSQPNTVAPLIANSTLKVLLHRISHRDFCGVSEVRADHTRSLRFRVERTRRVAPSRSRRLGLRAGNHRSDSASDWCGRKAADSSAYIGGYGSYHGDRARSCVLPDATCAYQNEKRIVAIEVTRKSRIGSTRGLPLSPRCSACSGRSSGHGDLHHDFMSAHL